MANVMGGLSVLALCAVVLPLPASVFAEQEYTRQPLGDLYTELGCIPRLERGSNSTTSYDCTLFEKRDKTKCYVDGKQYNVGEAFVAKMGSCSVDCNCNAVGNTSVAYVSCAQVQCPENNRFSVGCYHTYTHDSCCAKNRLCYGFESNPTLTCKHGSLTYYEGEKFHLKEELCKVCICGAGYQGRAEAPFCQDLQCGLQLYFYRKVIEGCVPVFYGSKRCCPIEWRCPDKEDKVQAVRLKERTTTETCKFGGLVLESGEALESPPNSPLTCFCQQPPYLTCFSTYWKYQYLFAL